MVYVVISWLLICYMVGSAAKHRGQSRFIWCVMSVFTTPLLSAIMAGPSVADNLPATKSDRLKKPVSVNKTVTITTVPDGAITIVEKGPRPDQAYAQRLADHAPIIVKMSVAATPTNPPVITGTTNLPDGTLLMVYLLGDPPACIPKCAWEYKPVTVELGHFTAALGDAFRVISGSYTIDITTPMASKQPKTVQAVIGESGERLRGPYVVTFENGKDVPVNFPRNTGPSESEKLFGYTIHYTQRIQVAGDAATDRAKSIAASLAAMAPRSVGARLAAIAAHGQSWDFAMHEPLVGTKRKCRNARVFPKLGVDRLCHQPAGHGGH